MRVPAIVADAVVVDHLRHHPLSTPREIAVAWGGSSIETALGRVCAALKRLRLMGRVCHRGSPHRWSLIDGGRVRPTATERGQLETVRALITEAIDHQQWQQTPTPVQRLIESAWLEAKDKT